MPYIVGSGTLILEVVCIVHAFKTGRVYPWIFLLIFLPLVGCIAYLIVEMAPEIINSRRAHSVQRGLGKFADPDRDLRARKRDVELVGSADAKRKLAEEYMRRAMYGDAVDLYRSAATGMHKDDPALLFVLARAQLGAGDGAGAQASLDALQAVNPGFTSADAHLVYARALEAQGKNDEALADYKRLVRYFPGEEARCRYAQLPRRTGNGEDARAVFMEIIKSLDGAPRHYQRAQKEWGEIARRGLAA